MYEEKINEIIQNIKNDIEVDKLEISKIRKEINKLKNCIKEKISKEKKAIYRLNKAIELLK